MESSRLIKNFIAIGKGYSDDCANGASFTTDNSASNNDTKDAKNFHYIDSCFVWLNYTPIWQAVQLKDSMVLWISNRVYQLFQCFYRNH